MKYLQNLMTLIKNPKIKHFTHKNDTFCLWKNIWWKRVLPCTEYWPPPPAIVFCWQLKVGERYGNTSSDTEEDAIHDEEDAKQGVLLTSPQSGKNIVQLNWYCTAIDRILFYIVQNELVILNKVMFISFIF